MTAEKARYIPCFLCGNGVDIRTTKRKKPYFICDPCGLQAFIRHERGIALLDRMLGSLEDVDIRPAGELSTLEVHGLANRLAMLRSKIADIEDAWEETPGLEAAATVLRADMEAVGTRLQELAKRKS